MYRFTAGCLAVLAYLGGFQAMAATSAPIATVIAEFDNLDTAGESAERTAAHAARVHAFAGALGHSLSTEKFEIVALSCTRPVCSPKDMPSEAFLQAARDSGARLVVYGAIQKMSTLVQIGVVQAIDMKSDKVVLNQHITFRGDSDEAFRRAATFVTDYLNKASFTP